MSSIGWVWWHRCSGHEDRYSGLDVIHKVVWCPKEWIWCHREKICCHEFRVCDDIKHYHSCHTVWMWWDVDWVWCHTCAKCDDIHTCFDVISRAVRRYRCMCHLCDDTDTVAVMSSIGWVWWHRCSGHEDRYSGLDVIKWCDVLKSGYDVIERRSVVMNFVYVMS